MQSEAGVQYSANERKAAEQEHRATAEVEQRTLERIRVRTNRGKKAEQDRRARDTNRRQVAAITLPRVHAAEEVLQRRERECETQPIHRTLGNGGNENKRHENIQQNKRHETCSKTKETVKLLTMDSVCGVAAMGLPRALPPNAVTASFSLSNISGLRALSASSSAKYCLCSSISWGVCESNNNNDETCEGYKDHKYQQY